MADNNKKHSSTCELSTVDVGSVREVMVREYFSALQCSNCYILSQLP